MLSPLAPPTNDATSGYWYPDSEGATTVEILSLLRRYRSAETAMRARTRASMRMNETDLMALRHLLREKHAGRPVRAIDLARHLHISSAPVTALVDRLVRAGHAPREPHPTDRRTPISALTSDSALEVRATLGIMHRRMMSIAEGLPASEARIVASFLEQMRGAVDQVDPAPAH